MGVQRESKKHIVSVWVVLHKRTLAPMGDDDDAEDMLMALLTYPCPLSGHLRTAGAKSPTSLRLLKQNLESNAIPVASPLRSPRVHLDMEEYMEYFNRPGQCIDTSSPVSPPKKMMKLSAMPAEPQHRKTIQCY
jgi:hypothetical protein